jgi:CBS domain-containing protein
VLQAFKLMRKKRIGGIPVVESGGSRAVGNISLRDVQFLLTAPEIYHDYRFVAKLISRIVLLLLLVMSYV